MGALDFSFCVVVHIYTVRGNVRYKNFSDMTDFFPAEFWQGSLLSPLAGLLPKAAGGGRWHWLGLAGTVALTHVETAAGPINSTG